jgi:hypothetical protein
MIFRDLPGTDAGLTGGGIFTFSPGFTPPGK